MGKSYTIKSVINCRKVLLTFEDDKIIKIVRIPDPIGYKKCVLIKRSRKKSPRTISPRMHRSRSPTNRRRKSY